MIRPPADVFRQRMTRLDLRALRDLEALYRYALDTMRAEGPPPPTEDYAINHLTIVRAEIARRRPGGKDQ